jgi:hypothetical protein
VIGSLYLVGAILIGIGFGPVPRALDLGSTRKDVVWGKDSTDNAPTFAVQRLKTGWHG